VALERVQYLLPARGARQRGSRRSHRSGRGAAARCVVGGQEPRRLDSGFRGRQRGGCGCGRGARSALCARSSHHVRRRRLRLRLVLRLRCRRPRRRRRTTSRGRRLRGGCRRSIGGELDCGSVWHSAQVKQRHRARLNERKAGGLLHLELGHRQLVQVRDAVGALHDDRLGGRRVAQRQPHARQQLGCRRAAGGRHGRLAVLLHRGAQQRFLLLQGALARQRLAHAPPTHRLLAVRLARSRRRTAAAALRRRQLRQQLQHQRALLLAHERHAAQTCVPAAAVLRCASRRRYAGAAHRVHLPLTHVSSNERARGSVARAGVYGDQACAPRPHAPAPPPTRAPACPRPRDARRAQPPDVCTTDVRAGAVRVQRERLDC
jgi:hypothetical protein